MPNFLCLSAEVLLLSQYFTLLVPATFPVSICLLVTGGHLGGSWGEHRNARHASTGNRVARQAAPQVKLSPRAQSQACPGFEAMVRNGSRVVPLFGVMLKLDMEGMAAVNQRAGVCRVVFEFVKGFFIYFPVLLFSRTVIRSARRWL